MLRDRLVVILILLPIGVVMLLAGGIPYLLTVLLLLNLSALEFCRMFSRADLVIPAWIVGAGASALVILRMVSGFDHIGITVTIILLVTMVWFLCQYERGTKYAATGMGMTIGGTIYLGWMTAYFISLRQMPYGLWWTLIVIAVISFADSMALVIGQRWGRHLMAPHLSPKKTWEGYFGGMAGGILSGLIVGGLMNFPAGPASGITWLSGLFVGVLISLIAPVGDLVVSMMKREVDRKDTGDLLPGHGGALDRMDSWLVAAPIGYYLILLVLPMVVR